MVELTKKTLANVLVQFHELHTRCEEIERGNTTTFAGEIVDIPESKISNAKAKINILLATLKSDVAKLGSII